jgi:multiple sugar transport system substrate-binding protein
MLGKMVQLAAAASLLAVTLLAGCGEGGSGSGGSSGAGSGKTIKILWAKWEPADALQKLSEEYTKDKGVKVFVDQQSWDGAFAQTKQAEFNNNGQTYDIIIGDSQWVGQGVTGGHYAELTDTIATHGEIFKDVSPKAMEYYCEYPKGSKKYYAIPCESDAMACVYRKDLFESPKHKAGYKKFVESQIHKHLLSPEEMELGVPKTWEHFLLIARYFKEASGEPDMVGVVMPTARGYDEVTMAYEPMLWSFGGDWGDQAKRTVTIDSPESVQALSFMKQLVGTSSAGGKEMGYAGVQTTYTSGRSAMAMTYFAFFPAFASKDVNRDYWDKTGYFNVPAGPTGKRFTALGGQGMSLNNHISDQRKKDATDFMLWFSKPESQAKWAALGGFSANTQVLASEEFKKAAPYNHLFQEAFDSMQDFWNVPQYDQMLSVAQDQISGAIKGDVTAEQAMKTIQAKHEEVLKAK